MKKIKLNFDRWAKKIELDNTHYYFAKMAFHANDEHIEFLRKEIKRQQSVINSYKMILDLYARGINKEIVHARNSLTEIIGRINKEYRISKALTDRLEEFE